MTKETREEVKLMVGLAPLHGSSPPLVKNMLLALLYSSSVTPPK